MAVAQGGEVDGTYFSGRLSEFQNLKNRLGAAQQAEDSLAIAGAYFHLGLYYFEGGRFEPALSHYLDAERMLDHISARGELTAELKANLGTTYHYTGYMVESLNHLNEALEIYKDLGDSTGIADVYGRKGHYHEKLQDYETALEYQHLALSHILPVNDSLGIACIFENFGSIYEDLGNYDLALTYFVQSLAMLEGSSDYYRVTSVYNNMGDVYRKKGLYAEGQYFTRKALQLALAQDSPRMIKSAVRDLAKSHEGMGSYDSAYHYLNQAYTALDSIFSLEVARSTAENKVLYDFEKQKAQLTLQKVEIAFLEKEQELSRALQYTFGGAFVVLLLISLWLFRLQRQKIRSNKLIYKQREDIYEARRALDAEEIKSATLNEAKLKTELENKRLREIFLNEELEMRSNELTNQTLKIIRKNKVLSELRKRIEAGGNSAESLRDIGKIIDAQLRVDKNWENFQDLFEKVHSDFYKQLLQRSPDLTPTEIRLSCLLKLNIPSKDIASMLGISQDSLRVARYRLRKKLHLDGKERLGKYMMSLG